MLLVHQGDAVIIQLFHLRRRGFGAQRHKDGGDEARDEAGNDLIQAGAGQERQPQDVHDRAANDAGGGAREIEALPEKAQQDGRAEGRAEDAPGVGYQVHDGTGVGVGRKDQRQQGDDEHHHAAGPQHLFVAGLVLAHQGFVDVACKGRRGREQLAVRGGHGGGQDGGEQDAGNDGREDIADHGDEHQAVFGDVLVHAQHHAAEHAHQYGEAQDQESPGNADLCGFFKGFLGFHRHEADDDVGHAEIAQAPAQAAGHVLPGGEHLEEGRRFFDDCLGISRQAGRCEDGGDEQGAEHQKALEKVRPAHGGKAAQEGVTDDDQRRQIHGKVGVDADDRVEQSSCRLDAGGGVNGVGHQEDDRADDLQRVGF